MPWTTYLHHFGVGGRTLVLGLWIVAKTGACRLQSPEERFWFGALIVGCLWLAGIHFFWIEAGLHL